METHEDWSYEVNLAQLRKQLQVGIGQLDNDHEINIQSTNKLDNMFDAIQVNEL